MSDLNGYDSLKSTEPPSDEPINCCTICGEAEPPEDCDDDGRCLKCAERFAREEDDASRESMLESAEDYRRRW